MNEINAYQNITQRLLGSFPTDILRSYFKAKGSSRAELEAGVVSSHGKAAIWKQFVPDYFGCMRLRVNLFHFDAEPTSFNTDFLECEVIYSNLGPRRDYVVFVDREFRIFLSNPDERLTILYKWPIRFTVDPVRSLLTVAFSTFARNIKSLFEPDRIPLIHGDATLQAENSVLAELYKKHGILQRVDLNSGLKHLWAADIVDCPSVGHYLEKSFRLAKMSEGDTFKSVYPDEYTQIVQSPLGPTRFNVLDQNSFQIKHFSSDASQGILVFDLWTNREAKNDLLRTILEHNQS